MNLSLYSPKIYLFAFHLVQAPNIKDLGEENREFFWHQCQMIFDKFSIEKKLRIKSEPPARPREELLEERFLEIEPKISIKNKEFKNKELTLEGFAYPIRIDDSYGLGLAIGFTHNYPLEAIDIADIYQFNRDNILLPDSLETSLGQTIIITAWLSEEQKQKDDVFLKNLADKCIENFIRDKDKRPEFLRQGELFNSSIFEYGLVNQVGRYRHVLVWLFADPKTDERFEEFYNIIFDLLFYRNKIITKYKDSRETYRKLYGKYEEIIKITRSFSEETSIKNTLSDRELKQLKNKIKQLIKQNVEYSACLKSLDFAYNTTKINTTNYQTHWEIMGQELEKKEAGAIQSIEFLKEFIDKNCPKFQEQIKSDLDYFYQGEKLLERAIEAIRGVVEIDRAERDRERLEREKQVEREQAQRDRSLERTIQRLGIAFGGGAIVSGVVTQHIDKPFASTISLKYPIHPLVSSLLLSVLATAFFYWLACLFTGKLND